MYFNVSCKYRESYNWEFIVENLTKWKLITGSLRWHKYSYESTETFFFVEYSQNSGCSDQEHENKTQLQPDFFLCQQNMVHDKTEKHSNIESNV